MKTDQIENKTESKRKKHETGENETGGEKRRKYSKYFQ